jgi:small conductance mechanosensitive channel
MDTEKLQPYIDQFLEMVVTHAPVLILAIVTLVIGLWLIKKLNKQFAKLLNRNKVDESLHHFLLSLIAITLKVVLVITVAGMVGVKTTSFIAILGAAGLAIGLALQGSLANFAGGVLILLFKPYKVGDLVEASGETGWVKQILIFNTILISPDNKTIILPNSSVSNGPIKNMSREGSIRVELSIGIAYDADLKKAKEVILAAMKARQDVLETPAPSVNVAELGDSSVNFAVFPYATAETYWDVYFGVYEDAKLALDAAGIEIPFPQRVLSIKGPIQTS